MKIPGEIMENRLGKALEELPMRPLFIAAVVDAKQIGEAS